MATEVSCGQCHGRLLVETLGVVVACPHCGVHLSIPAPSPEQTPASDQAVVSTPPSQSEPVLDRDTDVELPTSGGGPFVEEAARDPGDIEVNFPESDSASNPAGLSQASSSIFGSNEESSEGSADEADQIGWHSAPNLSLNASSRLAVSATAPSPRNQDAVSSSASLEPSETPSAPSEADAGVAMFASFGEPAPAAAPTSHWNFAPAEAATPVPSDDPMFLSASQQFTLESPGPEGVSGSPMFSFGEPSSASPVTVPIEATVVPATAENMLSSSQQLDLGQLATASAAPAQAAPADASTAMPTASAATDEPAPFASEEASSRVKALVLLLFIVGSYASAVTLALIYLLVFARPHPLESLPDVKPPMRDGEIAVSFYSPKNDVPSGHTLALGKSERFGSVRVTPIKVTRGSVKFEHYSGQRGFERSPSDPVLKLWLKFENVSNDQTFAPLDPLLLFRRKVEDLGAKTYANNFLCAASDRRQGDSIWHVFDLPVHSEFRMIGQSLDRELKPGESQETFVPSEEGAAELKGDLVWRLHIRKGYHPQSFRGVTTLIDVTFNSQDVTEEQGTT